MDRSSSTPQLAWRAQALWEQLRPLLPGLSVEVQARADSTNTQLIERARADSGRPDAPVTRPGELDGLEREQNTPLGRRFGDASPCLLVAETQTRGRGRLGRGWQSSPGASLTFSLALALAPVQWGGLSLAVGLALAEALEPRPPARPRLALKWPNDLWLRDGDGPSGRKLGGILIETVSVGQRRLCVVGVGLNITPQHFDGLAHGYACVQELSPYAAAEVTAPAVLAQVATPLVRALLRFEREGFAPLVGGFARRDLLAGQAVQVSAPQALQGVAEGVDEQGALLLRHGDMHRIVSGEVSVRLQSAGAA